MSLPAITSWTVEGPDELLFLVAEVLADALADGDGGAFELQHRERDTVDVEHHVRALGHVSEDGDLLGDAILGFSEEEWNEFALAYAYGQTVPKDAYEDLVEFREFHRAKLGEEGELPVEDRDRESRI